MIHLEMSKILKRNMPTNPEKFLLGLSMEMMKVEDKTSVWYNSCKVAIYTVLEARKDSRTRRMDTEIAALD